MYPRAGDCPAHSRGWHAKDGVVRLTGNDVDDYDAARDNRLICV